MKKIKYNNNYFIYIIMLVIIIYILLNTLFINPIIGKVDNGDFERLMRYGGLSNIHNNYNSIYDGFLHNKYLINRFNLLFLPIYIDWVSCAIILKISVIVYLISNKFSNNLFDIRYLSFIYSILFLVGIFLIISFNKFNKIIKVIAGLFIILFFTSVCYISYFNSFFGEAGTIVFFFLSIGTYLHLITQENMNTRYLVYFFIASGGFLTSKSQNIPLLVFMLIIYIGLYINYKQKKFRKNIIIGTMSVILICSISYFSLTDTMNENNLYQSVFLGVLKGSKSPEKDLQQLGINKKFIVFYGHSFYDREKDLDPMGKEMLENFYPNISFKKILLFYINNPNRLWEKIVDSANNSYDFKYIDRSNFIKGHYNSNKKVNNFRIIIINKYKIIHNNIFIFITFSLIYLIIIILYFIKYRNIRLLLLMPLFILASGCSQLILPAIGSGYGDFSKHLFLLNLSYDTMFGISILWIVHIISKVVLFLKNL